MKTTPVRFTAGLAAGLAAGALAIPSFAGLAAGQGPRAHAPRQIALTFDDLPVHGALPPGLSRVQVAQEIVATLTRHAVPEAYGFVNARTLTQDPATSEVLEVWRGAGFPLGNHAYSHMDLHTHTAEAFEQDVVANEPTLQRFMGATRWKWFRYPYLREGDTAQKYADVRAVLAARGYRVAQVTVDFNDYAYNAPFARCTVAGNRDGLAWLQGSFMDRARTSLAKSREAAQRLFGRDIPHVMLLHVGAFHTVMLSRLLDLLRDEGFSIVPLATAQADAAYDTPVRSPYPRAGTLLGQLDDAPAPPLPSGPNVFAELAALCAP